PDDVPAGVQADGRQILLYRHDGTLYALDNLCSHAAGLLSRGVVEGLTVTCPLHGSQYCLADGSVRRGPSHQPQPVIRTRVRHGWIEVRGNRPTAESIVRPAVPTLPVYAGKAADDAILVDIDQQLNAAPIPHRPYH